MDAVLMIDPPPRSSISGAACFMPSAGPRTRMSKIQLQPSAVISVMVLIRSEMPALLNRMSRPPNSVLAFFTAASMSASLVTSQWA